MNENTPKAIIDHRPLDITKKGEHLIAGVRGFYPQAAIRKDALKKNIGYFWKNVKWENEKNNKKSFQEAEAPSAIRHALEKAGYIDHDGRIKEMQRDENTDDTNTYSIDGDTERGEFADVSENLTDTKDGGKTEYITEEEVSDHSRSLP